MAGARAATSLSLTIGVAFATLLVVAGILAGPAVLDCSHRSGGFGACLRGKVVDSGLLPQDEAPPAMPVLAADATVPPAVAEPSRNVGWIEANATEYETATPAVAQLRAPEGTIGADGKAAGAPTAAVEIALAEPTRHLSATGAAPSAADPAGLTEMIADPAGQLSADGRAVAVVDPTATSLAPLPGIVSATGRDGGAMPLSGAVTAEPHGVPLVTGSIGPTSGRAASAMLEASLSPIVPSLMPPALEPAPVAPLAALHRKPAAKAAAAPRPHQQPRPMVKYDPHYPNVLVLPPPNTGANSSFATLEVR